MFLMNGLLLISNRYELNAKQKLIVNRWDDDDDDDDDVYGSHFIGAKCTTRTSWASRQAGKQNTCGALFAVIINVVHCFDFVVGASIKLMPPKYIRTTGL